MHQFDFGRAIAASVAFWISLRLLEFALWGLAWLTDKAVAPATVHQFWTIGLIDVAGVLLAWVACVTWYFRNAPRGFGHGLLVGYSFGAVWLVLMTIENMIRHQLDMFVWTLEPWSVVPLVAISGLFGVGLKLRDNFRSL